MMIKAGVASRAPDIAMRYFEMLPFVTKHASVRGARVGAYPDPLIEPLKRLSAPAGIYYVTGNHEEFTDPADLIRAVQRTGIRVLNNEKVDVQGLQIVGVHDR